MRPLSAHRHPHHPHHPARDPGHDPAPSIWSYRAQRLWLTPLFHRLLRVGLPLACVLGAAGFYLSDAATRQTLLDGAREIRREIEARPEFRVNLLGIDGVSPALTEEIRTALALDLPISSFDLDLDALRARVEALPAVHAADLRIQSGGYLAVRVTERVPVLIWQTRAGPVLIDGEGHFVAGLEDRPRDRALPTVAGEGADRVVDEARAIIAAAAPLGERFRGLVRMGERRWDVVLSDDRRILLPEDNPTAALDRALALDDATDILGRDVVRIDMRNPDRLSVQLSPDALEEFRRIRTLDPQPQTGDRSG